MGITYALILSAMVNYAPGNKSAIYMTLAVFTSEKECEQYIPTVEKTVPREWAPVVFCEQIPLIGKKEPEFY